MATSAAAGFLGRSSNNGSTMRGLVQFIADLRNARARELEEKRINKELANIRLVATRTAGICVFRGQQLIFVYLITDKSSKVWMLKDEMRDETCGRWCADSKYFRW